MEQRELTWRERGQLWTRMGIRLALAAAALLLLCFALPPLLSLFMPFVLALVLAWLLNPAVRWIHKRLKISRRVISLLIILLVFAVAGGLVFWFAYTIGSEIYSLVSNWAAIGAAVEDGLNTLSGYFERFDYLLPDGVEAWIGGVRVQLTTWLQEAVPALITSVGKGAGSIAMSIPSWAIATVVFVMGTYFIVADYPRIRMLATDRMSDGVHHFLSQVRRVAVGAFGGYVRAQVILSVVVFFILLFGFAVTGQSYALLLAFLFAVMDFIPIIGSGTAMVPWAVVSLFLGDIRSALELMVIWGVVCLFRRLAEPKVVGNQTGLSPILSLISIYVGMKLAGVLGMVFGPVLVLIVLNVAKMDVFIGTRRDLKLAVQDVRAILARGREDT